MEYQSFVCKLNRPHDPSTFAGDQAGMREYAAFDKEFVRLVMTQHLITGSGAPGDMLVLVTTETLARLGVLDKVAPMVIGASLPKTEEGGKDLGALFSTGITVSVGASHVDQATQQACELIRTGSMFTKVSSNDPRAHSAIYLAMEEALFNEARRSAGLEAMTRVHQVMEGLVEQSEAPEVIGAEDSPYELLEVKHFAERMRASDQTVYNQERAGRIISVLPPGRERGRRYPSFQLSTRLNRALHQDAIAMYRSQGQDTTLYWDFLRTRHEVFGGSTGVDFLLNRVANPALQELEPDDLAGLFLETAEEDLHRAVS